MMLAWYSKGYMKNVIQHVLKIIDNKKEDLMFRKTKWEADKRRIDKQKKIHSWSTKGGNIAAIMVPSTPGGS